MELALILTILAAIPVACVFGVLIRKLAGGSQRLPVTAEWIDDLSLERYRPMLRLLDSEDLRYLQSQAGYKGWAARRFRAQRCQMIREYLSWLESDFKQISMAIRLLMVQSRADRPDLAVFLIRQKVAFHLGMLAIQMHLLVYQWGLTRVDVSGVMSAFDAMRVELREMMPASGTHA